MDRSDKFHNKVINSSYPNASVLSIISVLHEIKESEEKNVAVAKQMLNQ